MTGHKEIKKIAEFIENIQKEIGKPKFSYKSAEVDHDLYEKVENFAKEKMYNALQEPDKETRENNIDSLQKEVEEYLQNELGEEEFENIKYSCMYTCDTSLKEMEEYFDILFDWNV